MMGSGGVTGLTNLSLGNSIRIEADSIPVGGSITIVFTANVSLAAGSNTVIDNNARIYWDSLGDGDGNEFSAREALLDVDRDYGARPGVVEEPDPAILDNDPAQDTERVTVGSLAIGDTVWLDQNRNGVVDAGESGIPNVLVFIDLNRDGTRNPNEPFDLTDANGIYGISSLAPGQYSVRVDPATLPPGLLEVFVFDDPRVPGAPLLGGFSTEVLLDFTNEERADFGYFLPPIPPVPPVTPSPLLPPAGQGGEPSAEPEVEPETLSARWTRFSSTSSTLFSEGHRLLNNPCCRSRSLENLRHFRALLQDFRFSRAPRNQAPISRSLSIARQESLSSPIPSSCQAEGIGSPAFPMWTRRGTSPLSPRLLPTTSRRYRPTTTSTSARTTQRRWIPFSSAAR